MGPPTVAVDMVADLSQGIAHGPVGVELGMMLLTIPFSQRRKLLRNGGKETNDDSHGRGLHIDAKFVYNLFVLKGIVSSRRV